MNPSFFVAVAGVSLSIVVTVCGALAWFVNTVVRDAFAKFLVDLDKRYVRAGVCTPTECVQMVVTVKDHEKRITHLEEHAHVAC